MTTTTQIRASDDERERTRAVLREAAASGRLSEAELDERLATASEARFRDELDTVILDLPSAPSAPDATSTATSVGAGMRGVGAALAALVSAIVALALRHRVITAVVVILVVAGCVAAVVLGAWDFGPSHGGDRGEYPRMRR